MVDKQSESENGQYSQYIEEIDLQKYWLVLKRRWLPALAVLGTSVALGVYAGLSKDSYYKAEGKVLVKNDRVSSLTGLNDDRGQVDVLNIRAEPLATQVELVKSLPVLEDTVKELDLRDSEDELLEPRSLLRGLVVKPIPGTEVLKISYQNGDPIEATRIVNQIMASYRSQNIANNREEAAAARKFIEEQLPTTELEVARVEASLRQFKENNNVISLEQEASTAIAVLSRLDQDKTQLQAEMADIDARLGEIQGQLGMDESMALALSSLNQSEGIQKALSEIHDVQTKLSNERSLYREGHPRIEQLQRRLTQLEFLLNQRIGEVLGEQRAVPLGSLQMGDLRQNLIADSVTELRRLSVERKGLTEKVAELNQASLSYRQRVDDFPGLERIQRDLERQLSATQTTYETLLTQLQEIRVVENQTVGNVQVVSLAVVPKNPAGPNRKIFVVGGAFAGLLLSLAAAFILDLLDNSVKNVKEVKELFGYPLLGVIPLLKESETWDASAPSYPRVLVNQHANASLRDTYQMLQANLKFLQSDTELKTVVVTSSVATEGKSEVSANLAVAFAQIGRRVLLVDADMRSPGQHHAFDFLNRIGLSQVITGQATVEEALQTAMPNLDVLTAGVIPPNPVALLDSKRMESLLQRFTKDYEMVIIDVPPLVNYADASILGKMAGALLMVTRPGVLTYSQGRAAKATIERSNQRVLGLVVNGVNPKNEPDSYFYWAAQDSPVPLKSSQTSREKVAPPM